MAVVETTGDDGGRLFAPASPVEPGCEVEALARPLSSSGVAVVTQRHSPGGRSEHRGVSSGDGGGGDERAPSALDASAIATDDAAASVDHPLAVTQASEPPPPSSAPSTPAPNRLRSGPILESEAAAPPPHPAVAPRRSGPHSNADHGVSVASVGSAGEAAVRHLEAHADELEEEVMREIEEAAEEAAQCATYLHYCAVCSVAISWAILTWFCFAYGALREEIGVARSRNGTACPSHKQREGGEQQRTITRVLTRQHARVDIKRMQASSSTTSWARAPRRRSSTTGSPPSAWSRAAPCRRW